MVCSKCCGTGWVGEGPCITCGQTGHIIHRTVKGPMFEPRRPRRKKKNPNKKVEAPVENAEQSSEAR